MKDKDIINWESVSLQIKEYGRKPPFDHVVIDNFFKPDFAEKLSNEFPDFDDDLWLQYNNAIEIKKLCNSWQAFPAHTYQAFCYLNSPQFCSFLSEHLLDNLPLFSDSGLHGGGWHIHSKGGKLNTHLDYSLHPKLGLQRKLNIIIYMNPNWQEHWGGALGLWGNEKADEPGELISKIWSKFNRAVIFDTTQNSWHGLPDPLECPSNEARKSLAAYFLIEPELGVDTRGKALFAPTDDQKSNPEVLELIKKRSSTITAASVYNKIDEEN